MANCDGDAPTDAPDDATAIGSPLEPGGAEADSAGLAAEAADGAADDAAGAAVPAVFGGDGVTQLGAHFGLGRINVMKAWSEVTAALLVATRSRHPAVPPPFGSAVLEPQLG